MAYDTSTDGDQNDKLQRAMKLFEESVDHNRDAHAESHRAERFYHNSECEGQWESADLQYLRDQMRPAFSFNIIRPKVDTFLGMYADAQRRPMVSATGQEDTLLAEVLDAVTEQLLQDAKYESKSARQLKTGTVTGECGIHVEVGPSKKGRGWIEVQLYRILPFELHWDIGSVEPDRSDARHVFWDRWLSKEEFVNAYPDQKGEWDRLGKGPDQGISVLDGEWSEPAPDPWSAWSDDYDGERVNRYYFDRNKNKLRVIRYEYKTFVTKFYAVNEQTGERSEVGEDQRERIELAQSLGMPVSLEETKEEVVKVCEFCGGKILAEYDQAGPFEGFSIVPYTYMIDEETGTAYGIVRNLFDPQMELNKAKSLEIEHIAQAIQASVIAEDDAITDEEQFMREIRRPGGLPRVKKGKLSTERGIEIVPPSPVSQAVTLRQQGAVDLLNEISGIPSVANVTPAEQAQAGVTTAIRYNKSRQSVQDAIANFEDCQKEVVRRVVEAVVNAMPDDQIQTMLGTDGRWQVGNGFVVELVAHPEQPGQMVPKARAPLRRIRGLHWNLEMEYTSENSTLRMLELQILMEMMAGGIPMDPEVMIELATPSRSRRERLKSHVEKAQQAAAEGQKREAETFERSQMAALKLEAGKAREDQRHNMAQEQLDARDQVLDFQAKLAALAEKTDEAELKAVMDLVTRELESRRQQAAGGTV